MSLKDVEWKSAIMKRLAASTELSDEAYEKFISRKQTRSIYDELELTQEQADALAALTVHDDIKNYKAVPLSDKDIK